MNVPQRTSKRAANFQMKRSKVKVTKRQKNTENYVMLPIHTGGRSSTGVSGADCTLRLTYCRLLSMRRSAAGWTAA